MEELQEYTSDIVDLHGCGHNFCMLRDKTAASECKKEAIIANGSIADVSKVEQSEDTISKSLCDSVLFAPVLKETQQVASSEKVRTASIIGFCFASSRKFAALKMGRKACCSSAQGRGIGPTRQRCAKAKSKASRTGAGSSSQVLCRR